MIDGWQWDSSLFKGSAGYYERGRLPYAPGFADRLAKVLGLDGSGRLLDAGCGPGTVTLALAPFFAEAVGVDPDEDMLAEASRRGIANASWVLARAEDLPAGLGVFRTVVFANSFHWTDRDRVAATVFTMLEPGGAFVHMSDLKDSSGESALYGQIRSLVRAYLGPVRRAGQGTLPNGTPGGEDLVLANAGFVDFERHIVESGQTVERNADDVVAWVFSRSESAPHLFGDRLAAFERDLRALVPAAFVERVPSTEIKVWRTPN